MRTAVYAGSFDPFTLGHCDIMRRASRLFDRLYITVLVNSQKSACFTADERREMIESVVLETGLTNVSVSVFDGLLADYASSVDADFIVRGIRSAGELEYELTLEQANKHLSGSLETVYFAAEPAKKHISSSMVREIASFGGNINGLVPNTIKTMIAERLNEK